MHNCIMSTIIIVLIIIVLAQGGRDRTNERINECNKERLQWKVNVTVPGEFSSEYGIRE